MCFGKLAYKVQGLITDTMILNRKWLLSCPGRGKEFTKLALLIFHKKRPRIEQYKVYQTEP